MKDLLITKLLRIIVIVIAVLISFISFVTVMVQPYEFLVSTDNKVLNTGLHLVYPWQNYQVYSNSLSIGKLYIESEYITADNLDISKTSVSYIWHIDDQNSFANNPNIKLGIESEVINYVQNFVGSNTYDDVLSNQTNILHDPIVMPINGIEIQQIILTHLN